MDGKLIALGIIIIVSELILLGLLDALLGFGIEDIAKSIVGLVVGNLPPIENPQAQSVIESAKINTNIAITIVGMSPLIAGLVCIFIGLKSDSSETF